MEDALGLRSPWERLRLAQELRRRGFTVRLHAYEYIAAKDHEFAVLVLELERESALLVARNDDIAREIVEVLSRFKPKLRVEGVTPWPLSSSNR